jgi:hypothetical protein
VAALRESGELATLQARLAAKEAQLEGLKTDLQRQLAAGAADLGAREAAIAAAEARVQQQQVGGSQQ